MRSEIRSLQARVRALQRKYAPQLAFIRLRKLAEDYVLECEKARASREQGDGEEGEGSGDPGCRAGNIGTGPRPKDVPQPETHTFVKKIVKAGFRLRTFAALHKCIDRFREKDAIPEPRDILLALIPLDWERINRHMPKNSDPLTEQ